MAIGEAILILVTAVLLYVFIVPLVWRLPLFIVGCSGKRPRRWQLLLAIKVARMTDWMVTIPVSRSSSPLLLSLSRLSIYLFDKAEYEQCAAVDEERIKLLEEAGDTVGLAQVMSNVSVQYMFNGLFDRAIALSVRTSAVIENGYKASLKEGATDLEKIRSRAYAAEFGSAMFSRDWVKFIDERSGGNKLTNYFRAAFIYAKLN